MCKKLALLFLTILAASAQTVINGSRTITGIWDASGASRTAPAKSGTSLPGTCTVGDVYFKTDATAGQNLYYCTATNTWTQQLNSGGGGSVASIVGSYSTITGTTCNASNDGQLGFPTLGTTIFDYLRCKNGTGWENILQGSVLPASDWSTGWTNDNAGSAVYTTSKGGLTIETVTGNDQFRARYRTAPSTPYNVVVRLNFAGGDGHAGIYLGNGSNGNIHTFHWYAESDTINHRLRHVSYTSMAGAGGANVSGTYLGNAVSGRYADICVSDDGTNLKYHYSRNNGVTWTTFYSISRTTLTAPTRWGVYAAQGGGASQAATGTFAAFKENSGTATCSW